MVWDRIRYQFLTHRRKQIIGFLLFFAFAAILFANLYDTKQLSMSEAIKTGFSYSLTTMVVTIISTIVHMLYLYILLDILIFKHQIEKRIATYKILIPIFLFLAYFCSALQSWANIDVRGYEWVDKFNIASFAFFILLYVFWAYNDFKTSKLWFIIDIISIGFLVLCQFGTFKDQWVNFFMSPNGVVILCLIFYFSTKYLSREEIGGKDYKSDYEHYRNFNKIHIPKHPINIDFSSFSSGINVLDFGCGSGERLREYQSLITPWLSTLNINKITGCERLKCYNEEFIANVCTLLPCISKENITFKNKADKQDFLEADFIVLSHVIYENDTVCQLVSLLKKCKPNTIVLVRVCSPNSFYAPVSIAGADNILGFKKNRGHLGYVWINKIIEKARYREMAKYTIKQEYMIDDDYKIKILSDLLQSLYDGYLAYYSRDYLTALKDNNIHSIPNDDLIYILQKL